MCDRMQQQRILQCRAWQHSHLAEHDVLAVEPLCLDGANEELGTVGVGASVGHGEDAGAGVLVDEVFVTELLAVNGLATSAVALGEVTTLEHELGNDPVEDAALEVQRLALLAHTLLAGAERAEVLSSVGHRVSEQLQAEISSFVSCPSGRTMSGCDRW